MSYFKSQRRKSEELMRQAHCTKAAYENVKRMGLEGDVDLQFLLAGGRLQKVCSSSWKKMRTYKLLEDCSTMWQESHKFMKSDQTFSINDIQTVRRGRLTEGMQKYTDDQVEDRCFSIIFKGRQKTLDLIAGSPQEAAQWVAGLQKLIAYMGTLNSQQNAEHWIYNCMHKADKNKDNKMNLKELKHFMRQINIEVTDAYAEDFFHKCDTSNSETLEGPEIKQFYDLLTQREEVDDIYKMYAVTNGEMSTENLLNFLLNEQQESATVDDALGLIQKYELDDRAKKAKCMTKDGFLMYLNQAEGLIFNPSHKEVYQDMSQPLNHYFISSSHNTYLMEDQLKGPSSTEAYIRALMKSCRCVELDCWDGTTGEPVVYHGYTLTSKVLFKDVIKAIKEHAFKTSEYPVILSLEVHCTVEQQRLLAQHLVSILGSALLTQPLEDRMPTCFPSPEELKGRFLVKGKRLNKLDVFFSPTTAEEVDSVSEEDEAADSKANGEKPKAKAPKIKLSKELSDIVIYCKSVHFNSFEHARNSQAFYEMSSFKESIALELAKSSATQFIRHNTEKLSRIYPAGSRTDSSNYNPVPMWNAGCQIVALNFQTPCKQMDLNQGRFLPNGLSGFILKPAFMRDPETEFDPITLSRGQWLKRQTLHIRVISAQQLPKLNKNKEKSIVDPFVRVEIYGVPEDKSENKTPHINNNGFNPKWDKTFKFNIFVPELALVRFVVEDYDTTSHNDFIGQYTLPFTSIQKGYRHIPLCNNRGHIIPSARLFVQIMVVDVQ